MKKINDTTGNIGPCRLSYLNAFKPKMNELRNEFQYGAWPLVDPDLSTKTLASGGAPAAAAMT